MGQDNRCMENQLIPYVATPSFGVGRVLVLAPHPDDEVFGCGGAILRQVAEGGFVQVIVLTDGDHSPGHPDILAYGRTRREESINAANVLGYGTPIFWGLKDRGLEYGEQLVQRIAVQIQLFAPGFVFAPSVHEMHPDHRALGMASLEAVRRHGAALKLVMYEVGVPMPRPSMLLDISDIALRKQDAMACFSSQLQGQAYDQQIRALNCFRTYTLGPSVTSAEAYTVIDASELERDSLELYESEYQRQRSLGLPMMPKDIPLVSVIVCRHSELQFHNTLDSIAIQTYSHVEVIIVCSTRAASAIEVFACGRFPLRKVLVASTEGPAERANAGLKAASGEYFVFLDADDLFLPDHLEKLVRSLDESDAHAAYTGVKFVNPKGNVLGILDEPIDFAQRWAENFSPSNAVLVSRSMVEKGCQFDEVFGRLDYCGFWLQIAAHTAFQYVPKVSAICKSGHPALGSLIERQRLQTSLDDIRKELTEARVELNQLRAHIDQLSASNAVKAEQAYLLEKTVREIHASTSWKVTGPLRLLSGLLRGHR